MSTWHRHYGLLLGWLGYIIENHCPRGLAAADWLLTQKALIDDDQALWEAAPEEIKQEFYSQFQRPKVSHEVKVRERAAERLSNYLAIYKEDKTVRARLQEIQAEIVAKMPKQYPTFYVSPSGLHIEWKKMSRKKKRSSK